MTIKIIHSPSLPDDIKAIREQRKEVCQTCSIAVRPLFLIFVFYVNVLYSKRLKEIMIVL